MFDRALGCADARRRLLLRNHARLERRRDCDRALIDCGSAVVAVLDGSARGGLNPELLWVMLDGQRLFNRLGEELLVLAGGEDACDTKDVTGRALDASRRARLAADLGCGSNGTVCSGCPSAVTPNWRVSPMWCGRLRTYCVGERL